MVTINIDDRAKGSKQLIEYLKTLKFVDFDAKKIDLRDFATTSDTFKEKKEFRYMEIIEVGDDPFNLK